MITTLWILVISIIPFNCAQFVEQYPIYNPGIAPYPLLCKAQQLLTQTPLAIPQQPPIPQMQMNQFSSKMHPPFQFPAAPIPSSARHQSLENPTITPLFLPLFPLPGNSTDKFMHNSFESKPPSEGLRFLLPLMDIDIEIDRTVFIMQEMVTEDIFILHGHELFQLFLGRQEKRLSLLCYLEGSLRLQEPQAAEIVLSHGNLLLVVAFKEHLEIYNLRKDVLQSRAELLRDPRRINEIAPVFPTVQQLTIKGNIQKLFVIKPNEEQPMIVVVENFSKLYGKIKTFVRSKDIFEPMEELTIPALNTVNVLGSTTKYMITGKLIKNKTKTILTIYEIDKSSLQLHNVQILTVDSIVVQSISFQNKNLLIACSSKQTECQIFLQQNNGSFIILRERTSQELSFDNLSANSKFIMASKQNHIMVFTDHFLDSYGKFNHDLPEINLVMGHYNAKAENFVIIIQKLPFRLLLRTVEIEMNENVRKARQSQFEGSALADQHKLFLKSLVDRARSFLPPSKEDMNIFHRMADLMIPKSKRFETKKTPSNNPFERFMELFVPKKEEPEEIDIIDLFENLFSPNPKKNSKTGKSTMDLFSLMDDIIKTDAKEAEYKDPITKMFENFIGLIRPRRNILESEKPVKLKSGNIKRIQIQNVFLKSPKEILDHVNEMKKQYMHTMRWKREDIMGSYNLTLDMKNHLNIKKIKVKNLIYKGEVIKGFSLNSTLKPLSKLIITPKIFTYSINASSIIYSDQKRDTRQFVPDLYYDLLPSTTTRHLKVFTINGIDWSEFYNSIFLKNRDTNIKGRLVMQSYVEVGHLNTPRVNELIVDQLFNLRKPQLIKSDLLISRFLVHDLKAERVNGLKFEDDIVFSGREAFVETPVTMHHLSISGDLIVADKKIERFSDNNDEMEFNQFYTNKVIINGSLVVNNIKRENGNQSKILIDDKEFEEEDIKRKYLLKDEEQNFSQPINFDNAKIFAPHLYTKFLNDYPTEDHMLRDRVNNTKPLLIVFMKTMVMGDIICRDYKSKLAEIKENLIRPGDVVKITGLKRFEAPVAAENLETPKLNDFEFTDFVFKTDLLGPIKFFDSKRFNKLIIQNPAFVEKGIEALYLNNLALEDLLNHDYHMDRLYVPHTLSVSNLIFHKINGIAFDEFFMKLGVKDNQLILHKDLIVEGNVVFADPVELEYINDLQWNIYVENLARTNEKAVIEGHIIFNSDLSITEELWANKINNINLEDIFENILRKSRPQLITGHYTFNNMKASNVDLLSINGRQTNEYIDLTRQFTEIDGDIMVPKIIVKGYLKASFDHPFNFDNLSESIQKILSKSWRNIRVLKNVTWKQEFNGQSNIQMELFKYLYKNAVRSKGNQVISGNVKLERPYINNMATRLQFPNNIDIKFIASDAVLKKSSTVQKITGVKNFLKSVYTHNVKAQNGLYTNSINNIDIMRFNHSLYRLSSKKPIAGNLRFLQPLRIGHLYTEGLINGLNTSFIYEVKNNSVMPPVTMTQLSISNDIFLKAINRMNLKYFLDNRVTLNGPALDVFGFLKFENLIIEKEALLQSINEIAIDNLVFKHSTTLQSIMGHKSVNGFVELVGPAHVMHLNGRDLMELYRRTLFIDQNYEFDKLIVDKLTLERGLQRTFDGNANERSFQTEKEDGEKKTENLQYVSKNINETEITNNDEILYLDYHTNISVKWQKTDNKTVDYVNLKELSRISCCEKKFLKLSYSHDEHVLFFENITSNRLSKFADNIAVKVENFCKFKYRKVKSKISITAPKLLKVFGLKRFVENIDILSMPLKNIKYVILHALDLPSLLRNEVRVFKIDTLNNTVTDWQGMTQNIGEKVKIFQLSNNAITLITNGHVNNHPSLTIYRFNTSLEKFKLQQIIDGDYDIIEMVKLQNYNKSNHLIITCRKCQKIFIYENYDTNQTSNYEIYQIISLKSNIDKLFMFKHKNDNYMFVLSENQSGFYYLYKYLYAQGWTLQTYGYFPNLQMSIGLSDLWMNEIGLMISDNSDSIPLLVLCNSDKCHIVNAVI